MLRRVWDSPPPHDYVIRGDQPAITTEIAREVDPEGCPPEERYCARHHPRVRVSDGRECNLMHQIWADLPAHEQLRVWIVHAMGLLTHERDEAMEQVNRRLGISPLPTVLESERLYLARSPALAAGREREGARWGG